MFLNLVKKLLSSKIRFGAFIVFIASLISWGCFTIIQFNIEEIINNNRLQFNKNNAGIQKKINTHIVGLQGVGGIYLANQFVNFNKEFRNYAQFNNYFRNFTGALGFGFIRVVKKEDLNAYLKKMKSLAPNFEYRNIGQNPLDFNYIIEAIEPLESNLKARGFDIASDEIRRSAAINSISSALPTLTSRLQLMQRESLEPGFVLLMPLYKNGFTPKLLKDRKSQIVGWSYVPILMSEIFSNYELGNSVFNYEITDITQGNSKVQLVLAKEKLVNPFSEIISVGERQWLIRGEPTNHLELHLVVYFGLAIFFILNFGLIFFMFTLKKALTEQDVSRQQLKKIERWNSALLDSTSFFIISTEVNGIISTINDSAQKALQYSEAEVMGKINPGIFHLSSEVVSKAEELTKIYGRPINPGFDVFVTKALIEGFDCNEWTYVRKDGTQFPVKLTVTPIFDELNNLVGFVGVGEDLTDQKLLAKTVEDQKIQFVHNAKMTSLGEMAGGVAHEINTPLTVILNKAKNAKRSILNADMKIEEVIRDLDKIESTSLKIAKIVNGLKRFSRNADRDQKLSTSLLNIIEDTLELCQEKIKFGQIKIEFKGNWDIFIACKASQISQVFLNLISNSIDAIENLEAKWIELKIENNDDQVFITLKDSGKGIDFAVVQKLMQPFFTTKEVGKGTGLGLSISKGIIEDHGGTISYVSDESHTTFLLTFPINKSEGT